MTAVDVDALDKLRSALVEAMTSSARGNTYAQWAATILPVVVQFANERAAEKADSWGRPSSNALRARADHLDPS